MDQQGSAEILRPLSRFRRIEGPMLQNAIRKQRSPTMVPEHGPRPWSPTLVRKHGPRPWSPTMVRNPGEETWCSAMVPDRGRNLWFNLCSRIVAPKNPMGMIGLKDKSQAKLLHTWTQIPNIGAKPTLFPQTLQTCWAYR